jgi:hypothetical protein
VECLQQALARPASLDVRNNVDCLHCYLYRRESPAGEKETARSVLSEILRSTMFPGLPELHREIGFLRRIKRSRNSS